MCAHIYWEGTCVPTHIGRGTCVCPHILGGVLVCSHILGGVLVCPHILGGVLVCSHKEKLLIVYVCSVSAFVCVSVCTRV